MIETLLVAIAWFLGFLIFLGFLAILAICFIMLASNLRKVWK